jgi:predicted dehydrogenase
MSSPKHRIATVGTWGHIGQPLSELTPLPNVQFVGHARATPDDSPQAVHAHTHDPSVPWFDDYRQMLRDTKPQVAIISTHLHRITPIAIEAAQAGCHLICEKPLAIDHTGLAKLWDTCIANQVQCISMLGNGRHPGMQAAATAIAAGKIGDVVLLNARKSYKWGKNRPEWFGRRDQYGTTISWIAIHAVEMIHLLANQRFTSVAALQSNRINTERPACQDNGVMIFTLSGGGHASVSFDYLRPDAADTHGDDWVRIVGSRGVIQTKLENGHTRLITHDQPERDLPEPQPAPYYTDFLDTLDQPVPSDEMRRAFMLSHVCLVAADAADRKTVEPLPPMPWDNA